MQVNNQLTFMRTRSDTEHIKLKSLDLKDIMKFIVKCRNYMSITNMYISMAAHVQETVQMSICSQIGYQFGVNRFSFTKNMTNAVFLKMLQKLKQPKSKLEMYQVLDVTVSFPVSYKQKRLFLYNFLDFYTALTEYLDDFIQYFKFLSDENTDNIPALNLKKDQGLLWLLLSKIPHNYGTRALLQLPDPNVKQCTDFYAFMDLIDSLIHKDFALYQLLIEFDYRLQNPVISTFSSGKRQALAQITEDISDQSEIIFANEDFLNAIGSRTKGFFSKKTFNPSYNNANNRASSVVPYGSRQPFKKVHDSTKQSSSKPYTNGCFSQILYGECRIKQQGRRCDKDHSVDMLQRTAADLYSRLGNSKYLPSSSKHAVNQMGDEELLLEEEILEQQLLDNQHSDSDSEVEPESYQPSSGTTPSEEVPHQE